MQALKQNGLKKVQAALADNPEAARDPFFDFDFDMPLCFAVKSQCDVAIIQLLLEHGADVEAQDAIGRSPMDILMNPPFPSARNANYTRQVASLFLSAGVDHPEAEALVTATPAAAAAAAAAQVNDPFIQLFSNTVPTIPAGHSVFNMPIQVPWNAV